MTIFFNEGGTPGLGAGALQLKLWLKTVAVTAMEKGFRGCGVAADYPDAGPRLHPWRPSVPC